MGLKDQDGPPLALDPSGDGSFKDYLESCVVASAQKALDAGQGLAGKSWISIDGGEVTGIDFGAYLAYLGRMETPPEGPSPIPLS